MSTSPPRATPPARRRAGRAAADEASRRDAAPAVARISIGALSRATGIPIPTLRTWEQRYGFPTPQRTSAGHRVYPVTDIPRLRRVAELTARGIRTGDAITASDQQLRQLLDVGPLPRRDSHVPCERTADALAELLALVTAFDARALVRELTIAWGRLGALAFARDRVAPLLALVGDEWARGALSIRHEHFLTECLQDVLRAIRLPLDERSTGPLVVLATPPGEPHTLGLHMVALLLNSAGCRVLMLGPDLPMSEIAAVAGEHRAAAVGVSVSRVNRSREMARRLRQLRGLVPPEIELAIGGDGAPTSTIDGAVMARSLDEADAWARRMARGGLSA